MEFIRTATFVQGDPARVLRTKLGLNQRDFGAAYCRDECPNGLSLQSYNTMEAFGWFDPQALMIGGFNAFERSKNKTDDAAKTRRAAQIIIQWARSYGLNPPSEIEALSHDGRNDKDGPKPEQKPGREPRPERKPLITWD